MQLVVPLPGFKLGLSNIVIMLVLCLLPTQYALLILIPRCVLSAVFGGGITGLAFSLCGGLLALVCMVLLIKNARFSIFGVSIAGAAAHNVGQILAAMVLLKSVYIAGYLPYLLLVAILTGFLTGSVCAGVLRVLPAAIRGRA
jgi:heptaprenyl diphosphate synthase